MRKEYDMSKGKRGKYTKRLKPKFKLEYLRKIEENLVLHCLQPHDTKENFRKYNPHTAPAFFLERMVKVCNDLKERYIRQLDTRVRVDKAIKGKTGLDRVAAETMAMLQIWEKSPDKMQKQIAKAVMIIDNAMVKINKKKGGKS